MAERDVKKVPLLRGKSVFNLFFENVDAHAHDLRDRRQAPVGRRDQPEHRRVVDQQGRDAARHRSTTWSAMHADMFVVRHAQSGAPHLIAAAPVGSRGTST